jgi:hypothetical protein
MMRRERIEKKPVRKSSRHLDVLPLDPRDPDVLRAKVLVPTPLSPRRRTA